MLAVNRQEKILELLNEKNFVKVSALSKMFGVSEETIRRDMEKLESQGFLRRIHGGATLASSEIDDVPPIALRKEINMAGKKRIAKEAVKYIKAGDSMILDSGSTTLMLAQILPDIDISVITNDINIAYELSHKEKINLILTGGTQRKGSYSLVGPETERFYEAYNVQKLFLSTSGIHLEQGLSVSNTIEAHIKKKIISCAQEVICLADITKFNKTALVTFAPLDCVHKVICDEKINEKYERFFKERGIETIIAAEELY
ncbi:MAG: hypothetical protein PWP27_2376 [Clostridiales bacterium]|jgi:DeoR/GlpR family transcriptional regulator of sugar metabolism|nr:hypothetical protein [Clostridiales bacterium]MDK2934566.1 hypothetical protein [Clostridiales bacterium]